MLYDAFICHAGDDKEAFVRPLVERLMAHHLEIWFDEFTLEVGQGLRRAIERGLSNSRFAIVVLSPAFFSKPWPQRELDGLVAIEVAEDRRLVLPVLHGITPAEVARVSPMLADIVATQSASGLDRVCESLLKRLRPEESPLIAARDELIRRGIQPPVITDEWWLDTVGAANRVPAAGAAMVPEQIWGRWSFPLPHQYEFGTNRGLHLAWTAMQVDWTDAAEAEEICQTTHPDEVHAFIERWPGLAEICQEHPDTLALYAPQLTIPEFSGQFSEVFDVMLEASIAKKEKERSWNSPNGKGITTDGNIPECEVEIALRHPTFGNYVPRSLAAFYVHGEMFAPPSRFYEVFDYAIWLLSEASSWLPPSIRTCLTRGMRDWAVWPMDLNRQAGPGDALSQGLYAAKSQAGFLRKRANLAALDATIEASLTTFKISGDVKRISADFIDLGFIEGTFEFDAIRAGKRRR